MKHNKTRSRITVFFLMAVILLSCLPVSRTAAADTQKTLTLKQQVSCINQAEKGREICAYQGAALTEEQTESVRQAVQEIRDKDADVSFVMMNLRTGKMISYNPTKTYFGASTVKGPYTIAVNRYYKKAWKKSKGLMKKAVIPSNNWAYRRLRLRYGNACMRSLCRLSGVRVKLAKARYPYPCAKDLAKWWCGSYTYLKKNKKVPKKLRGYFSKVKHSPINYCIERTTYSKPGWMEGSGIDIYNDAGIVMSANGPYVMAIMTTLDGDDHPPIRNLVRVLNSVQDTM